MFCKWHAEPFFKARSLHNWVFFSRAFLSSRFDQWLVSPSFILCLWYYIVISPRWRLLHAMQTSVPAVASYTQPCLFLEVKTPSYTHSLYNLKVFSTHNPHMHLLCRIMHGAVHSLLRVIAWPYSSSSKATLPFSQIKYEFICVCWQIYKEIEICPRATKVICFDKAESIIIGYGTVFDTLKICIKLIA